MAEYPALKLGKLPPKHDPRTLMLRDYLDLSALPPVPASKAWDHSITAWGMCLNDQIGDCTCAAVCHYVQMATVNAAGTEITIPDGDVLTAYEAVSGYRPGHPETDNGAYELDVLKYWRGTGVGGHKLGAWADVDLHNHDLVKAAILLFGATYIGFNVPNSAMQQFNAGQSWDVVANDGGIVGGHAVVVIGYDTAAVEVVTWGRIQRMSWAFWDRYCDEVHAVMAPEWVDGTRPAPSGFDVATLTRDLALVSGQPDPGPPADPATVAFYGWQQSAAAWTAQQYPANAAGAKAEEAVIAQQSADWLPYLTGQSSTHPTLPGLPA